VVVKSVDLHLSKKPILWLRKPRACQNVLLEHGYLMGKLGRSNVCELVKGDVELLSDTYGIVYIPMDETSARELKVTKELQAAGYDADANKLFN